MRGKWLVILILGSVAWISAQEKDENEESGQPPLPGWEEGELEDLESGEYVPGSSLIGRLARESLESDEEDIIELAETVRALPEVEEEEGPGSEVIPEQFLAEYFHEEPQGLLNDPQKLLTTQEFRDREGFLSYHAKDHEIVFYLYLFDQRQKIPGGLELEDLVAGHLDPTKPSAVVFYFLGEPERARAAFTQRLTDPTGEEERSQVLKLAIGAAEEMSDRTSQLEAFSMQFSSSLSWLEEGVEQSGGSFSLAVTKGGPGPTSEDSGWADRFLGNENLFWLVVGGGLFIIAGLLGWLGRVISNKRRSYYFPDAEGGTLMEAPYAAGVGGVLSFASAQTPPSRQESDVPDYLQRM